LFTSDVKDNQICPCNQLTLRQNRIAPPTGHVVTMSDTRGDQRS